MDAQAKLRVAVERGGWICNLRIALPLDPAQLPPELAVENCPQIVSVHWLRDLRRQLITPSGDLLRKKNQSPGRRSSRQNIHVKSCLARTVFRETQ